MSAHHHALHIALVGNPICTTLARHMFSMLSTLLGECEIKLARWVHAARHLGLVLQDKPDGPERARLDTLFKQARAQVGGVTVQSSLDGADVFADNQITGRTPLRSEVFVEPGDVTMSLKKTSVGEIEQVVHVTKGGSATVHLDPAKTTVDDDRLSAPEARSRAPIFETSSVCINNGRIWRTPRASPHGGL